MHFSVRLESISKVRSVDSAYFLSRLMPYESLRKQAKEGCRSFFQRKHADQDVKAPPPAQETTMQQSGMPKVLGHSEHLSTNRLCRGHVLTIKALFC